MAGWQEMGDEDLVKRTRAGERDAWRALVGRYSGRLWGVARGMRLGPEDAADAMQVTWLRLVEQLDALREPGRVGSWLTTTMRRQCLDTIARRRQTVGQDRFDDFADPADPLDKHLLRTERDAALWRALRSLGSRCETLLRLLMAEPPPSYATVAETLDMPIGSIGPTRQRCLAQLRDLMSAGPYPFHEPGPA